MELPGFCKGLWEVWGAAVPLGSFYKILIKYFIIAFKQFLFFIFL